MAAVILSNAASIQAERARKSFAIFAKEAWHVMEPGTPYVGGWHLDALAYHLEAVARGDIHKLLINMPPRFGKSSYINVLWSVWLLLTTPSTRLLCASYALNLATRDNVKSRRLIRSPWFQVRYGHVFQLANDQDAKMKFETNKLGYRMAVSVGSAATGEGFDVGIVDDLHAIDEKESTAKRESALDWFDNTWCTRLNDPRESAMVVVGQRIHEQDVSGHILNTNDGGEWVHLNLPAEYESASPCKTILPGKQAQLFWQDPRQEDGKLLWEARFPRDVIEKAKRRHGPLGYSALYGQRPTPATGGTFSRASERLCTQSMDTYFLHTPRGVRAVKKEECTLFLAVDPAISEKQSADYMVIGLLAQTPIKDLLLLDVRRDRWNHHDQQEEVEDAFNDGQTEFAAVETVAYQHALFQDLVVRGIPCRPFQPHKDKVARAVSASIWQSNGKIYFLKDAPWLPELQKELYKFPKTSHDDQVDMLSLASIVVRSRGPLSDDNTDEDVPDPIEGPIDPNEPIPLTVPFIPSRDDDDGGSTPPVVPALVAAIASKPIDAFAWIEKHGGW